MAVARRASRRRYVLLVIVLTAVTLITLDTRNGRSGPLGALGRGAHTFVGPVQSAVDSVTSPIADWWHGVTDSGHLKSENRKLRAQIAILEGRDRAAQQAIDENETLRKFLGLNTLLDVPKVTARIIGRDPGNFDSTLTIDHGTERGIAVDMPVVDPAGNLVGTVIQVGAHFAIVRVLTDPQFSVGVKLPAHPPSNAATGIARGQAGGAHELIDDDVDALKKVIVGDRIVTSASEANLYPPDLMVGEVTRVEKQPSGLPQHVFIKPYTDLGALEDVAVLLWVQGQGPVVRSTTTTTPTSSTVPAFGTTTPSTGP
jgi:rod shape-determining protein MreC